MVYLEGATAEAELGEVGLKFCNFLGLGSVALLSGRLVVWGRVGWGGG